MHMLNKNSKFAIILAILFELVLIITAIVNLLTRNWVNLLLCILAMVCLTLPFFITYIANRKNLLLPPCFQLMSSIFIFFAQYLGEIVCLYEKLIWWDSMLHGVAGAWLVIIALYLTESIITKNEDVTNSRFLKFKAIWAVSFTTLIGVLWEIFELVGDYILGTHMVDGQPNDSATDLVIKLIVALFTSTLCYYNSKKNLKGTVHKNST